MALPQSRSDFKEFCLRKLGKPVIQINLDNTQIEDRIDEALQIYKESHFNGSDLVYLPLKITSTVKTNKFFDLSATHIIGISRIFPVGTGNYSGVLSAEFLMASDAMWNAINGEGMLSYQMQMDYLAMVQELTIGQKPIRYNTRQQKLYIDLDWASMPVDSYVVAEGFSALDETSDDLIWTDPWLISYSCALIKRNWGEVMSKYDGVQMAGGITINGNRLFQEGSDEVAKLEQELLDKWSLPPAMLMG
jgi:hypothetical protein